MATFSEEGRKWFENELATVKHKLGQIELQESVVADRETDLATEKENLAKLGDKVELTAAKSRIEEILSLPDLKDETAQPAVDKSTVIQ